MEKYTNKYEVALSVAEKFGSTNDHLSNIFEALLEIGQLKGLSVEGYSNKYEILRALALNEGVSGPLSNMYECLIGLAGIYGGTNFSNNYEAALYLLENAEAGFGGLCFTAISRSTIGMSHNGTNASSTIPQFQISRDGEHWQTWYYEMITLEAGEKLYIKGTNNTISSSTTNFSAFAMSGNVKASGNIMSLLYGGDYSGKDSLSGKNYCFYSLFGGCKNLTVAPKLPATTLASHCYDNMFIGTGLSITPDLPATTLSAQCYYSMFSACENLTETTLLPAKTLVTGCYNKMFYNCPKLSVVRTAFNTKPTTTYTDRWLYNVAETGTFYVAADAAWIDEVQRGNTTIPVDWRISGRTPIPYIYVMIDSASVRLREDRTFLEQGYTSLYNHNEYYPRFNQHKDDFTYNVNSYPMSGLELFTDCEVAVYLINVSIDDVAQEVNYYTTWFANGFNELYADDEFESESEVEEIDVDTIYPNEGDTVYTSYRIIPAWMRQAATTYNIPIDNLYNANKNYRFVDYFKSPDNGGVIIPLANVADNTAGAQCDAKRDEYGGDTVAFGSRSNTATSSRFTVGSTSGAYIGWNATYSVYRTPAAGERLRYKINFLNNRILEVNGVAQSISATLVEQDNYTVSLFGHTKAGVPTPAAVSWYIYNLIFTRGTIFESVYMPAINSDGNMVFIDLKTMIEYSNQGPNEMISGEVVSLGSKFAEIR